MNFKSKIKRMGTYDIIANVIVFVFAIAALIPLAWLVVNSLKPSADIYKMPPELFPKKIYWGNYEELFKNQPAFRWLFNSFFVSVTTTIITVIFSSLAAYAFAKMKFKGSNFIYYMFIGSLMIPKETFIIPLFKIVTTFNWMNTYRVFIVPNLAACFGVFLLRGFFEQIPDSIRESAKIEGANEWQIFFKIMLPMAKPGIGAFFILNFVTVWNDYLWQLLMSVNKEISTLTVGVAGLMQNLNPNMGLRVAGAAVASIPTIIIFALFQQYFTRGISSGAVKE